jgi:hypothetical protein
MNIVAVIGSLSLGIVVGWLVRYFIRRFKSFTPQALGFVISIIAGGAVIKFLEADKTVWWFYPIGLLVGFILYTIVAILISRKNGVPDWAYMMSHQKNDDSKVSAVPNEGQGRFPDDGTHYAPSSSEDSKPKLD